MTTLSDSGVISLHLEKILNLLQVHGFATLSFSQRVEGQQDIAHEVFYVEGCWRYNFFFRVEATHPPLIFHVITFPLRQLKVL